jgi:hypothetical protein
MSADLEKELRIAIAKAGGQKIVAYKMGLSEPVFSKKLSGERGWKINELEKLFEITGISISADGKGGGDFLLIKEMARKLSEAMGMIDELRKINNAKGGEESDG